ncbi:permease [Dehalogenimonas sp. THU2]|uniref:permease n=1 Tax=Dehalogenimonas sp. THU2 TaxID=3151121 RepID=UPI00321823B6
MDFILNMLSGGVASLFDYLSAHVLTCLVPAFFIAGGVAVFISAPAVLKYFGPQANKFLSYGVASVSGSILAVCSCTVLPLFAGIYKRGGGIGPATTFLFSGPAINILAIVYSARLLGWDIGLARAIAAVSLAIVIGLIMAYLFRKDSENQPASELFASDGDDSKRLWQTLLFFGTLVGILIFASAANWPVTILLLVALGLVLRRYFNLDEIKHWLRETWAFVKLIFPWLIGGVFLAGVIRTIIPADLITGAVGESNLSSNILASVFGALMYFATLTEVPILKAFLELGMDKGPALALLLAGPALSLPSMLVIRKIMGNKRAFTYVGLVVVSSTLAGMIFGMF